ncbi:multiple inositol polyphosphate phosphatase 1-like [Anticarsia gemmatalis]|uniref:multiple inositol polyphosphate phosphatase 1-like n=1 Tax=Anticarsia gemmatalis TaxID=129554 RepID=UPI003F7748FA
MNYLKLLLVIYVCIEDASSKDCYWNSNCKYTWFSSKTPYENVRGDIRDSVVKTTNCEAISIWSYLRHGKRNPGGRFAKQMKAVLEFKQYILNNYETGNHTMCAQDIENLRKWQPSKSVMNEPNELNDEGYLEMVGIASRLRETFPDLLSDLHEGEYLFHPAFGNRMLDSAKAFIEGLQYRGLTIEKVINGYDDMAPHATCGVYQRDVRLNPNVFDEVTKYEKTSDYLDTKYNIESKLGDRTTNDDIVALYDLCRYLWDGINKIASPWCALFTTKDLEVLEYTGDLMHYYRNGYGTKYSKAFGEIILADMLRNFESTKRHKGKKIISYFAHATSIDTILVALNLFKDANHLTGAYRNSDRKWRTTKLSTFGANLIAVLNKCKVTNDVQDYHVAFYLNEEPLLELCNQGVCSWQEFEYKFEPFLNTTSDFCEFRTQPN